MPLWTFPTVPTAHDDPGAPPIYLSDNVIHPLNCLACYFLSFFLSSESQSGYFAKGMNICI